MVGKEAQAEWAHSQAVAYAAHQHTAANVYGQHAGPMPYGPYGAFGGAGGGFGAPVAQSPYGVHQPQPGGYPGGGARATSDGSSLRDG